MSIEKVLERDRFAKLVGISVVEVSKGCAKAEMDVADHHLNGLDLVHGGAIFTLADMAFAAAVNSHGIDAVAINLSVNFLKAAKGGKLTAEAKEVSLSKSLGTYLIEVKDSTGERIANLQGTAFRMQAKNRVK